MRAIKERSGWVVFTLAAICITAACVVTMAMVSDFGIACEKNAVPRFLFGKLGMWGFLVGNVVAVSLVYIILLALRRWNVRIASSFLLGVLFLSVYALTNDICVFVAVKPLFPPTAFFPSLTIFVILSMCLLKTNKVPPLKF